jgi:hypothetical protein
MNNIYFGGNIVNKGNKTYVVISSNECGIEEVELNSCHDKEVHYLNINGACMVCSYFVGLESI